MKQNVDQEMSKTRSHAAGIGWSCGRHTAAFLP